LFEWAYLAHVEPPTVTHDNPRGLVFYLGPNHYSAGLYLPKGYNLEIRPADDEGWVVMRARDTMSEQILTMWAVRSNKREDPTDPDSPLLYPGDERVRRLDGES